MVDYKLAKFYLNLRWSCQATWLIWHGMSQMPWHGKLSRRQRTRQSSLQLAAFRRHVTALDGCTTATIAVLPRARAKVCVNRRVTGRQDVVSNVLPALWLKRRQSVSP